MDESLTERIETLKEKAAARETLRYPEEVRQLAIELVDELRGRGLSQERTSQRLDIPWKTLQRWLRKRDESRRGANGFRPVGVAPKRDQGAPVLVAPSGWRIEGLSVDELVDVARRLL